MPYTPPSPSPTASLNHSRVSSRSSSISTPPSTTFSELAALSPNALSKSVSYTQRHRRSVPSRANSKADVSAMSVVEKGTSQGITLQLPRPSTSLHQSPSPVNNTNLIPTGAVMSPPDSSQNSSDDEQQDNLKKRGRQLVNLAELEQAIRSIPQRKAPSPERSTPASELPLVEPKSPEMLSAAIHNKISHARSASDSYMRDFGRQMQKEQELQDEEDDDEEDENFVAPPMVRKKSGELVKSSLKSPGLTRRHSSMPSTPTYPKAVHFDAHLEHVRHFLQAEKPLAVSAGSSPVESAFESESEYPFPDQGFRQPAFEWDINLPNFSEIQDRHHWMVRVEKVVMSHDNKSILGTVAVQNIAFQKLVVARFTMDYWQTTSEVAAEFTNDVRRKQRDDGCDRFTFKIKLEDQKNLENKTLFFCVRYRVNDQEHWDSNCDMNYQVDFKKKAVPQNGKGGSARFSLPRSRPSVSAAPRPKSVPMFDDNFDALDFQEPPAKFSSKVKVAPPTSDIDEQEAPARRANPSGNAFGNRYDFEASLAAAITTAAKVLGPERSGLNSKTEPKAAPSKKVNPYFRMANSAGPGLTKSALPRSHSSPALSPAPRKADLKPPALQIISPSPDITGGVPGVVKSADKPSIESQSYRELLDNYCFFGSTKPSPAVATTSSQMPDVSAGTILEGTTTTTGSGILSTRNGKTSSRSPSPRVGSPSTQANCIPKTLNSTSSSCTNSQRSSRSASPINGFGFPPMHTGTVSFESMVTPTAIHT